MFSLTRQLYNFFHAIPPYTRAKRKKIIYFETLQNMRMLFIQNQIHHRSIDELTSLVYAFSRQTHMLKLYSNDLYVQTAVDEGLRRLEHKIVMSIASCNDALSNALSVPVRRRSI